MTYDEIIEAMLDDWFDGPDWRPELGELKTEYTARMGKLLSALRTLAEKRGYRLMVPVEATEEMTDAAIEAHVPGELDNITGDPRERLIACLRREYVAALSAAPDPTKEPTP